MSEWVKVLSRLGWTASLYGAERWVQAVQGRSSGRDLDLLAADLRSRMGSGWKLLCRAGEDLQTEGWALLKDPTEGGMAALGEALASQARQGLNSLLAPERGKLARLEFRNRMEVYRLVVESHGSIESSADEGFDLAAAVEGVLGLEPRRQLWAFEGLGHAYGAAALHHSDEPAHLLASPTGCDIPETGWPMLHAGLGLAIAEACLAGLGIDEETTAVDRSLKRFLRLCQINARPGHVRGAWDSLGFYARSQAPEWFEPISRAIEARGDRTLLGMFWHGAGRALYFLPSCAAASLVGEDLMVKLALRDAKTPYALENLQAGLGLASTLTNLAQPAVVERLLGAQGDRLLPGFSQGVASAAVIRSALTPDWTAVEAWLSHRPAQENSLIWEEAARLPFCQGLAGEREPNAAPLPFLELNLELRARNLKSVAAGGKVG